MEGAPARGRQRPESPCIVAIKPACYNNNVGWPATAPHVVDRKSATRARAAGRNVSGVGQAGEGGGLEQEVISWHTELVILRKPSIIGAAAEREGFRL